MGRQHSQPAGAASAGGAQVDYDHIVTGTTGFPGGSVLEAILPEVEGRVFVIGCSAPERPPAERLSSITRRAVGADRIVPIVGTDNLAAAHGEEFVESVAAIDGAVSRTLFHRYFRRRPSAEVRNGRVRY